MPTTPAQRAGFATLGLTLWKEMPGEEEFWDLNDRPAVRLRKDREPMFYTNPGAGPMIDAQVLQILDMLPPPPGMVLVPREVAERAESALILMRYDMNIAASKWEKQGMQETAAICRRKAEEAGRDRKTFRDALSQSQASTPTTDIEGSADGAVPNR